MTDCPKTSGFRQVSDRFFIMSRRLLEGSGQSIVDGSCGRFVYCPGSHFNTSMYISFSEFHAQHGSFWLDYLRNKVCQNNGNCKIAKMIYGNRIVARQNLIKIHLCFSGAPPTLSSSKANPESTGTGCSNQYIPGSKWLRLLLSQSTKVFWTLRILLQFKNDCRGQLLQPCIALEQL